MKGPDQRIITFIRKHHVLTLATSSGNQPWCANCFYVYMEDRNLFVFTSDTSTRHISDTREQPLVAGSIVLETEKTGKIRGLQFQGRISRPEPALHKIVRAAYLKRFPVAMLMKTTLWVVEPDLFKYTDNRLGFGKKLYWSSFLLKTLKSFCHFRNEGIHRCSIFNAQAARPVSIHGVWK